MSIVTIKNWQNFFAYTQYQFVRVGAYAPHKNFDYVIQWKFAFKPFI